MKRISFIFSLLCLLVVASLTSCKPGIPSEYIQRGDMEDILYDYHMAQAMLINNSSENTPENQRSYKLAVLKKHGVTEAQFERSLEYYMRHADNLHEIYEHLSTRFEHSAVEYGLTVSDLDKYGSAVAKGDTADIWAGDKSMILTSHKPFHLRSFALNADSTYQAGDKFIMNFDAQFIVQEGSREGIVVLAVRFANDSVASQLQRVSSNMHYTMQVQDQRRLGIKAVSGYFLLNKPLSDRSSTLKILSLTNMQLIRMHTKETPKVKDDDGTDSLTGERVPNTAPISPGSISMGFSKMKK